jgi:hypothetical protein
MAARSAGKASEVKKPFFSRICVRRSAFARRSARALGRFDRCRAGDLG